MQRPDRVTHTPKPTGPKRKIQEVADLIPPKVLKAVRDNVKLKPCCRDVETSHVQTFQSHPGMVAGIADLMEITCDCGRTQYRTHANVGNVNGPEPYGN